VEPGEAKVSEREGRKKANKQSNNEETGKKEVELFVGFLSCS